MNPAIGKVESHPFEKYDMRDNSISKKADGSFRLGGSKAGHRYELDGEGIKCLADGKVTEKIRLIFSACEKTLAERFKQGCGWLSRGRRSADRSERLLFFFTAIEALLSDDDKTAPVVQTIARHAAILLNDDNSSRVAIARDIRNLYGLRSALVHTGKRGVYDQDSNTAQLIAELLFDHVWEVVPLDMRHSEFVASLARASYGLSFEEAMKAN